VSWIGSDLGTPFNQLIRSGGELEAADGPAALAVRVAACVQQLRDTLPGARTRPVRRPTWGAWSISFDDFVASRMLELVIHCDDLACSVGLPVPAFPPQAVETVVDILSRIALRRHGATDVLRALSRSTMAAGRLASVWACGLALVGGHLVVAVTRTQHLSDPDLHQPDRAAFRAHQDTRSG
jgi:hypothetical protein